MFRKKIFSRHDQLLENDTAYSCGGHSISFSDFHEFSENIAGFLHSNGASPVIIYGHKSPLMLICIAACIKAQRAYVPCDISIPLDRFADITLQSGAKLVFCAQEGLDFPIDINGIQIIQYGELLSLARQGGYPRITAKPSPHKACYIMFTSGSTGNPKGVSVSYENVDNFIKWFTKIKAVKALSPRVILNQAIFSFDLSVADIYYSLTTGARLYALDYSLSANKSISVLVGEIKESGAALAVMTPSFAELCLCDEDFCGDNITKLKCIFFCGETLKPSTAKRLFSRFSGIRIINAYGPTEATCAVCAVEITHDMLALDRLPVGDVSSAAVKISIVDKNSKAVKPSVVGEIVLYGKSVAKPYGFAQNTGFKLVGRKEYYFTGDIGYISDGLLFITGRDDCQIKYKGYRIELDDIESNLCKIDGVKQALVIADTDISGEVISLSCYISCDGEMNSQQIRKSANNLLPSYMIPKNIIFLESLPLTSRGKIDRRKVALVHGNNN